MKEVEALFNIKITKSQSLDGDINYSNKKYVLETASSTKHILKIFPDQEEWVLANEESRILNSIGSKLSFQVPLNITTIQGDLFFLIENNHAKLLSYIEGDFIASVPHSEKLLYSLGKKIGELTLALKDIQSPIMASRRLFWDIQNATMSTHKVELIKEPERKKIIQYYLDRFTQFVLPIQHTLRHSIIHGDLNDYNILVKDGEVAGLLDFGDATFTPTVNDLAIAMTYMMLGKKNPFEEVLPLLKGYHSIHPLTQQEAELLPDLITTRLCISLCNSAEKKQLGQDNEYVLVSEKPGWELLEKWTTTNPLKIKNAFLAATNFKNNTQSDYETILTKRKKVTGKSLGLSYNEPIQMTSALFQYMFDETGNTYLDAYNNIAHVGHSHPLISQAISNQVRYLNTNTRYLYDSFIEYSEKLLAHFPSKLSKVFFVNSGSEANDLAIRMARTFTNRKKVAVLENGYHGNTSIGIEISSYKFDRKGGNGASENIIKLQLPNSFNSKHTSGKLYADEAIEQLSQLKEKPSSFIAEPISGCGGQVPLASDYLKTLYAYLNKENIVTISDEVQTGFGRLGEWFWGFEMHGVVPDIVVLGKPMGNGHPIAAVVTTKEIADAFANGMEFFSSFGGNPVSCKVASVVLDIIESENLQAHAHTTGNYFKESLLQLKNKYKCIGDVRGAGLFLGIEFLTHENKPDTATAKFVKDELKRNYILSGTDGPFDNVIKIKPPLCFSGDNVDQFVNVLESILKKNE